MDWSVGCWGGRAVVYRPRRKGDSKDRLVTMLGWDFWVAQLPLEHPCSWNCFLQGSTQDSKAASEGLWV